MRVFIPGVDGYLGWPLAQHLTEAGHEVAGADTFLRRKWVEEMGSHSAIPTPPMSERLQAFKERFNKDLLFFEEDLCDYDVVECIFREFQPEAIVHLGECPSAPYSMIDVHHATWVQVNNITSTFNLLFAMRDVTPEAHLVKLGTMGEYGTPNVPIPEGFFEIEYRGRKDKLPFPRQANSFYHQSKVHGSNNIMLACKHYGIKATDIMQGVVFGTHIDAMGADDPRLLTRLDFDATFGTAINRFSCQALIDEPLTPYGRGHMKRGFLPLRDSMQCLTIAVDNPAQVSEYRVFNQFEEVYDVLELAQKVQKVAGELGIDAEIRNMVNPRRELEDHYYEPDHKNLLDLGYEPTHDVEAEIKVMLGDLRNYTDRIEAKKDALIPDVQWDGTRKKVEFVK